MSFRIGCLSFGGAAGQIAMMHRLLVEEKRWIDERDFLDGLNFCTLLPGPEAQQLATFLGWRLHGASGGLVSGVLFVLPGAALILALAQAYVLGAGIPVVAGLLLGIKAAVIAIILEAVIRLARRALARNSLRLLALAAFVAMSFTTLPFPLMIVLAGVAGIALAGAGGDGGRTTAPTAPLAPVLPVAFAPVLPVALVTLVAWWLPVLVAGLVFGPQHLLVEIGLFFSKLAVVTFGGAYALLAYLSEEGIRRGWADAREMIDALGLAETTPGPTVLVNPFIAFLAGFRAGGSGIAWLAGLMAIWTTFAPSFLWIFAGGPFLVRLTANPMLAGALRGISAAVVGIIASVAFRFATVFLFPAPVLVTSGPFAVLLPGGGPDLPRLGMTGLAALLLFGLKWPLVRMIATMAGLGAIAGLLEIGVI
jgi:chromate transporter